MKRFLLGAFSIAILAGCNTKFSVNGEYDETPVVHMLLNPNDEFHFLKLNKTFLGDGNANDFAMVADSSYFDQVDARIFEVDDNDDTTRTWVLQDTIIENKESGTFYYPEQKLYYFEANDLNEDLTYHLHIDIENGKHIVVGETDLVQDININYPLSNVALNFAESNVPLNGYRNQAITFSKGSGAAVYQVQIRFDYKEHKPSGNVNKSMLWSVGTVSTEDLTSSNPTISASGELFYELIKANVEEDPDVFRRTIVGFDVMVTAGSEDLYTYMIVNKPTSSLAQNQPTFSNIEGAKGIFSARTTKSQYKEFDPPQVNPNQRGLSLNSTKELCEGQYTGSLLFCSDHEGDVNQDFYCN